METLRIGLVGTGGIGRTHIERINNTLQGGRTCCFCRSGKCIRYVRCREVRHQGL